ncbi:O-acyltransferase like protein-like isoform X2 [Uranotaenia lowii]|uniref:O-acyltransferase like protein-like isoform X2 n=1 Tax=Uranotaenia lowii TaxID=190385 RepID=UPI002478596C|nr:O-acyltransferase like protein-like isoform X2 [Uranotaenia lowii]
MLHYIAIFYLVFASRALSDERIKEPQETVTDAQTSWSDLPKLYDYDDFEDCRRNNPKYLYCVVKAQITANESSQQWKHISLYTSDPRHYRRDVLELGICLDRCSTDDDQLNDQTKRSQQCAIDRVWTNYHLNSTAAFRNCVRFDDSAISIGFPEIVFVVIGIVIIGLLLTSTIAEVKKLSFQGSIVVRSFSLVTNLKKLGALNSRSRQDLLFLDGARVLTMLIILLCHATIPMIRIPLKNPESFESQFDQFWFPIALAGNTYTVQIFFVIGGIVLAVNFLDHVKSSPNFETRYFFERIVNRLIRILPVYAFVILFQASWYRHLKQGPIAERYKDHCDVNWWTNLLFVNNYINVGEPCSQFTWYLGADFQLYVFGTTIMMMLWRYPKHKKSLLYVLVILAFIVPVCMIYYHKLDATVMMMTRYVTEEIRNLPYYLKVYVTFESNAGNYIFGMIIGMIYCKYSETTKLISAVKFSNFNSAFLIAAIAFIAFNGLTIFLPLDHLPDRSLVLAIFGSLLKSSWGIMVACLMFYLALNPSSLLTSFLQHPIMLVAAKLSYCVYVVQYTTVYATYRNVTDPIMNNTFNKIMFTSAILFITFSAALMLHVSIELSFMNLLKPLVQTNKRPVQKEPAEVVDSQKKLRDENRNMTNS